MNGQNRLLITASRRICNSGDTTMVSADHPPTSGATDATNGAPTEVVEDNGNGHVQAGFRLVPHDYHDFSNDMDGSISAAFRNGVEVSSSSMPARHSFPVRLHYCLEEMERDGLSHIVSWQPHGRCFVVHNKERFIKEVLGSWFHMSKMASFQRQLSLYGFQRITTGPDKNGYYHELFLRQRRHLTTHIMRFKVKGCGTRKAASPETEPNLYDLPFLPPNSDRGLGERIAQLRTVETNSSLGGNLQRLPPSAMLFSPFLPSTYRPLPGRANHRRAALIGQIPPIGGILPPAPGMATSSRNFTLVSALAAGNCMDRAMALALLQHSSNPN